MRELTLIYIMWQSARRIRLSETLKRFVFVCVQRVHTAQYTTHTYVLRINLVC